MVAPAALGTLSRQRHCTGWSELEAQAKLVLAGHIHQTPCLGSSEEVMAVSAVVICFPSQRRSKVMYVFWI